MKSSYYTPTTKVLDILKDNFRKSDLLNLLGIKYNYNDDLSVMEVCNAYGADCDLFLHICNIYTFDDYALEEHITGEFPVGAAVDYIVKAYGFFNDVNITQIKMHYNEIMSIPASKFNNIAIPLTVFLDATSEHTTSSLHVFRQYREHPKSITRKQVDHVMELMAKATMMLDNLIKCVSELQAPEEYKVQTDQLKFYLIFLRSDFDKHSIIYIATLERLARR